MNKDRLRELRRNHHEVIEMAREDDSDEMMWIVIGSFAALIDVLLTELIEDGEKAPDPCPDDWDTDDD